ncbi:HIT domain-containing protein [Terriglobus sp. TAA 43]|uniref:HIT family protein n=1 Tax=Terriglobus sp. TAA 43 TaxID=278961 RepID=UPI0006476D17|nr:HIT domain-containing protein [Terriglobus sp. TAA 43]
MDRLWTPWRYAYITGEKKRLRQGVPVELDGYPEDHRSVFLNMIGSVQWAIREKVMPATDAEKAAGVLLQAEHNFICLNAFPYTSGHVMVVPYEHLDSLAKLPSEAATEMMSLAQRMEAALRATYRPDGINLGMNLGEAAGAGVAEHLHLHVLPRWFGDSNFMTATAETRVLPEALNVTWDRLRGALGLPVE